MVLRPVHTGAYAQFTARFTRACDRSRAPMGLQGFRSEGSWTHLVFRVRIMSPKQMSLVGSLLVIWPGPIQAHDIYTELLTPSGLPCCHDGDCRPVPYRLTSKGVQMFVDEQWL